MFMKWDQAYAVGYPAIDADHHHLFAIANRLHDAVHEGTARSIIGEILSELAEYCGEHFEREEQIMIRHRWVGYQAHKLLHDTLLDQVGALIAEFEAGKLDVDAETLAFLKTWILDHTQGSDRELANFLVVLPRTRGANGIV